MLAIVALGLLSANLVLGLAIGDYNSTAREFNQANKAYYEAKRLHAPAAEMDVAKAAYEKTMAAFAEPHRRVLIHRLLGVAAALLAVLVNSITITYFIGTSRWCKEVVETYQLPAALAERSARLKRLAFPWALLGIFTILAIVSLGAAADPGGANRASAANLVLPHYLSALLGIVLIAAAFYVQNSRINENYQLIAEILAQVAHARNDAGSPIAGADAAV